MNENSKTTNCDKTQNVTKLKNSNCDQKSKSDKSQKLELCQKSKALNVTRLKAPIVIKLKNLNCVKTQELKKRHNSETHIVAKFKNLN